MIAYFVYIVVALILLFVVYITVKAGYQRYWSKKIKINSRNKKFNQENNLHNNKKVLPMNCLG